MYCMYLYKYYVQYCTVYAYNKISLGLVFVFNNIQVLDARLTFMRGWLRRGASRRRRPYCPYYAFIN